MKEGLPRKSDVGERTSHPKLKCIVITLVMVRKVIMRILSWSVLKDIKVKYIEYNPSAFLFLKIRHLFVKKEARESVEIVEIRQEQIMHVLIIQK